MSEKPLQKPYKRHIFVCTGPRCAPETSATLYQELKDKLKAKSMDVGDERILRSKSTCLGICKGGIISVVYPEAVWYCDLDSQKMDRVITEHLEGGKPVEEYCF